MVLRIGWGLAGIDTTDTRTLFSYLPACMLHGMRKLFRHSIQRILLPRSSATPCYCVMCIRQWKKKKRTTTGCQKLLDPRRSPSGLYLNKAKAPMTAMHTPPPFEPSNHSDFTPGVSLKLHSAFCLFTQPSHSLSFDQEPSLYTKESLQTALPPCTKIQGTSACTPLSLL